MAKRVYTKEEADAILSRALELHARGDGTSHDDLVAAGREVGLPAGAIDRAADELLARRRDQDDLREIRARDWRGFFAHLVPYVLVNVLLGFTNWLTGGPPWMLFVTLGWGIGLGSHLLAVANPDPRKLRRRLEREQRYRASRDVRGTVRVAGFEEPSAGAVRVDAGAAGSLDERDQATADHNEGQGAGGATPRAQRS
jgi:hypothetical protein